MNNIILEITAERLKQKQRDLDNFDKSNTRNDWVAYITSYAGDASAKVFKKTCKEFTRDHKRFRENMIKVAALAIAAIESNDNLNTFHAENK